ncbi:terminase large subunit [Nocardioides ochotonae]|uniref:terminase large subunit n=1 Tax=Nocardioides ochotonae TaxID=2685869 RepID=UPI00140E4EB4|nr:terminase large subunit [Nocardioides ochotonae]
MRHAPPRVGTVGEKVVGLARNIGLVLDPWQRDVILDAQSVDPVTGLWSTPRVAVSVPRQNGKGAIIEALEVAFLLGVFGDARLLIHSAHEFKTAQNGFQRLLSYFETVPALERARNEKRVKIGTAAAREFVTVDGRTVKFLARSKGSGRGFSADLLILDEAQELGEEVFAAILPTVSARPNPQIWLFGTPPSPTMCGEVFTRFRESALSGDDSRLTYLEWSATTDDPFDSPATWAATNPALGVRISEDTIRDEFFAMDEETFCRERLGMWDGSLAALRVIPEDAWAALVSDADPEGRVVFAVDVSPNRDHASIAVAGRIADGRVSVQVVDNRRGTGWVVDRLASLTARWPTAYVAVDSIGPAASLLPEMKRAKIKRIKVLSGREVAQACGGFYDAAVQGRLAHPDQPVLNDALAAARKRPLGDAWAWHRKDPTTDLTPLVAVTFAAFGLSLAPERTPSRVVIL